MHEATALARTALSELEACVKRGEAGVNAADDDDDGVWRSRSSSLRGSSTSSLSGSLRQATQQECGVKRHGHDSLSQIDDPVTAWLHLQESKARLQEQLGRWRRLGQEEGEEKQQAKAKAADGRGAGAGETTGMPCYLRDALGLYDDAIASYSELPQNARAKRGLCRCHQGICDIRRTTLDNTNATSVDMLVAGESSHSPSVGALSR